MEMQFLLNGTAIKEETLSLRTVTPLLMHGANSQHIAETRASSIKGIIRYWWRTLQFDSRDLLAKESELFGGTGQKDNDGNASPLRIHLQRIEGTSSFPLRPHRNDGKGTSKGIRDNVDFELKWSVLSKDANKMDFYRCLLEFTIAVGGFGQRARRGYGCLQITNTNWSSPEDYLSYIEGRAALITNQSGDLRFRTPDSSHPVLRNIWIGAPETDAQIVLQRVGKATSIVNAYAGSKYQLGSARPRQASPLHAGVRLIDSAYYPVIVEAHSQQIPHSDYKKQRNQFLRELGVHIDA